MCNKEDANDEDVEEKFKEEQAGFNERGQPIIKRQKWKQIFTKFYDITNCELITLPKLTRGAWSLVANIFSIKYTGEISPQSVTIKKQTLAELKSKLSIKKTREENYATLVGWKNNQALQLDPCIIEDTITWALIFFYFEHGQEIDSESVTNSLKQ